MDERLERAWRRLPDRARDACCLAGIALAALLCYLPLATGRVAMYAGDMEFYNYPVRSWLAEWWRQGLFPWWCKLAMFGYPLPAEGQASALYPGTWLLALSQPAWRALSWYLLAHLILAGVGMYAWCRELGACRAGSLLAGLTFALGGTLTSYLRFVNLLTGLAWLPVALAATERARRGDQPAIWLAGGALGCMLLAGHSAVPTLAALLILGRGGWRMALPVLAVGAGLGAAQWLPTLELLPHTGRWLSDAPPDLHSTALRLGHLPLQLAPLAPRAPMIDGLPGELPWEWNHSLGRLPLLLALLGAATVPRARSWATLAGVALILSTGGWPFAAVAWIPGLRPLRVLMLASFAAGPLIAVTATHWRAGRLSPRAPRAGAIVLLLAVGACMATGATRGDDRAAWLLAAAWIIIGGLLLARPPRATMVVAVVLLAAFDLGLDASRAWPYAEPEHWRARDPLTAELRANGLRAHAGFWAHPEIGAPKNLLHGVASTTFLSPLSLQSADAALAALESPATPKVPLLRAFRVGAYPALLTEPGARGFTRPAQPPLPEAWLAESWTAAPATLADAIAGWYRLEPFRQVTVELPGSGRGAGAAGALHWHGPNRCAVATEATGRPLLVIADGAYPGWRASIDSAPTAWGRVNGLYRGVPVPAGRHTVRWWFAPLTARLGMFSSLAMLAAWAARLAGRAAPRRSPR